VDARFTETGEFNRSNELSATLEGSSDPIVNDPVTNDPSLGYLPVFPGAQGFGTDTKAGRGGKIIKVTNLNGSGSGSLREALNASGPRIVVFEVSGTIDLTSTGNITIKNPYVTIAGQTAPSPGIALKGATFEISTHDVLVQHLRIRPGDNSSGPNPDSRDGLRILYRRNDSSATGVYNVVVDHVSVSWATDENVSLVYGVHEITISNSIIAEGLANSIASETPHSMGMLIRENTKNMALVGNLMASNIARNPKVTGGATVVGANNVLYNPQRCGYQLELGYGSKPQMLSVVGSVFIDGPNTSSGTPPIWVGKDVLSGTKIYHSDNLAPGRMVDYDTSFDPVVSSPPIWHKSIQPKAVSNVEAWVLSNAGARPADRDSADKRVTAGVASRTGKVIDSTSQVGGWPNLAKNVRTFNVPANPHGDDDGDGYTNVEEILQQMAAQVEGRSSN
jgi:hypothetical protein